MPTTLAHWCIKTRWFKDVQYKIWYRGVENNYEQLLACISEGNQRFAEDWCIPSPTLPQINMCQVFLSWDVISRDLRVWWAPRCKWTLWWKQSQVHLWPKCFKDELVQNRNKYDMSSLFDGYVPLKHAYFKGEYRTLEKLSHTQVLVVQFQSFPSVSWQFGAGDVCALCT